MIDLRSDTVTAPDEAMREAAATATVGDDVYGEDPTVNELETRAGEILECEAALFVPTGTMANQIAARVHTERGQEIVCEQNSHIYRWELGGLAQHSGLQTRPVAGTDRGVLEPTLIEQHIATGDDHRPGTGLVSLENTHNAAGGTAIAPSAIEAATTAAHAANVPVHLDGARLWNAAVAHDIPVARFTASVDSVMCALSKGLGAPIGSLLAGSVPFIESARRIRKLFGGGWRQAGMVAGPGLEALGNRDGLQADHERAQTLAAGLNEFDGLSAHEPETNIVLVDTDQPAADLVQTFESGGVRCVRFGEYRLRFVTHRDLTDDAIATAIERIDSLL